MGIPSLSHVGRRAGFRNQVRNPTNRFLQIFPLTERSKVKAYVAGREITGPKAHLAF